MKVKVESSRIVKPLYDAAAPAPEWMPLSVFDTATYDESIAIIYAFRPPNPPSAAMELGLARTLAVYREWAGRLGVGPDGRRSLIHRAVAGIDDAYFRSFVDFASSGAVEAEGLVPSADAGEVVVCPDMEVDSWLGMSFYDLDFGGGCPLYFMPSYLAMEGTIFLVPSFLGDGSIDVYVPLFENHLEEFKKICYNIA
uniref:Uncharacterized protein n=1 Tax=Oryza glumipatula TaxID=40148 RepID=A0A0D9ZBP0_9ORYZ